MMITDITKIKYIVFIGLMACESVKSPLESLVTRSIHGYARDLGTGKILMNVNIRVNDAFVSTDQNGYFRATFRTFHTNSQDLLHLFPYTPQAIDSKDHCITSLPDTILFKLPLKLHLYQLQLLTAIEAGYRFKNVITWDQRPQNLKSKRVIILRHDVDYDVQTAKAFGFIEGLSDVFSTYYFRWITADPATIEYLNALGHEIGLHYETLAYYCEDHNIYEKDELTLDVLTECRERLMYEIEFFKGQFGDINSISSHGAQRNRIIGISNAVLIKDQNLEHFHIKKSATLMEWYPEDIDIFIADSGGKWTPISFMEALAANEKHIYILMHPYWWRPIRWGKLKIVRP